MAVINIISQPVNGANVFNPMLVTAKFSDTDILAFNEVNDSLAIDVNISYEDILFAGESIRIIDGGAPYQGSHRIISTDIVDDKLRLTLNVLFTVDQQGTSSTSFIPDIPADFSLITGYSTGAEAQVKDFKVTSTIRVNPNLSGNYLFDISGFLRSRYKITEPLAGPDVDISLRFIIIPKSDDPIPDDTNAVAAYYGLKDLSSAMLDGVEAVGDRPILFFGDVPTLYSKVGDKGIINNFVANPNGGVIQTTDNIINLDLLSCESKEVIYTHTEATEGTTVDPELPSFITAEFIGDTVKIILNPCTGGVADYLAEDYNAVDYLTSGQLNSVTGCFSFEFKLSGTTYMTLNVCVVPVSELVEVCPEDTLNFAFLNERGGFSSFAIECKFLEGREFGNEQTVVTSTRELKRIEYRNVYDTFNLTGGVITKNQLNFLQALRSSIQVYLFNNDTQAFDIPIVINRSNFTTFGNRFNQSEVRFNFGFKISQQVRIQTQ